MPVCVCVCTLADDLLGKRRSFSPSSSSECPSDSKKSRSVSPKGKTTHIVMSQWEKLWPRTLLGPGGTGGGGLGGTSCADISTKVWGVRSVPRSLGQY